MGAVLQGVGVVDGIGIAKAQKICVDFSADLQNYQAGAEQEEIEKIELAVQAASAELIRLKTVAEQAKQKSQAEIMDAHYSMMNDPEFVGSIRQKISEGMTAPQSVLAVGKEFAALFEAIPDPYLKERAADVHDVSRRLVRTLVKADNVTADSEPVILCADELEASIIVGMPDDKIAGILLGQGSKTSHTVIIAKARGIPTITGLQKELAAIADGMNLIVDGTNGQVIENPSPEQFDQYQLKVAKENERRQRESELCQLEAITPNGQRILLAANIGSPQDMSAALKQGAKGVGLFRSEFLFMGRDAAPDEEEQFAAYKAVAEQCQDQFCIIRTMDIGGDKPLNYLNIPAEENPFLGWRAIRISLKRSDLFLTQLKAILRAGVFGKVAIMLPMIISTVEIAAARKALCQAMEELTRENKRFCADVPLGIMIETPAAAVMAAQLAADCDFFSIGTNDLVQYALAVDRGNQAVSELYSYFHPAVLALLQNVINAAHEQNIWVGMCGEMAGDPLALPLLVAWGIDELSMSAPSIPKIKQAIRNLREDQLDEIVQTVRKLGDAAAIRTFMENCIE